MSPLLAQSGHPTGAPQCPLLGVKRTSQFDRAMSACDPKRKSSSQTCRDAQQLSPNMVGCRLRSEDERHNEAARVHHATWQHYYVAACSTRATGEETRSDRLSHIGVWTNSQHEGISARIAATRIRRGSEPCPDISVG